METFLFYFGGVLLLGGGIAMVSSRSAVNGACWLILSFLGGAGLFAALQAPFLAVMQVLVYAGAVMVLFLFVIMMLEGPVMEGELRRPKAWVGGAAIVPVAVIFALISKPLAGTQLILFPSVLPAGFGQPARVAVSLLGEYVLAFELISIVLLVAIIGALSLGRAERSKPWK